MEYFAIELADVVIGVSCLYPSTREFCGEYGSDAEPKWTVSVDAEDIRLEQTKSDRTAELEGRAKRIWSKEYLETLAVYRKICERMPEENVFLMHGSVIAVDGGGYLFTAKSGTGKSTHTRLWREHFGPRAVMVNDDKPLLRVTEDAVFAYGTPWDGKHRLSKRIRVPLRAMCVLTRAEQNAIAEISAEEFYPMLAQQSYRPDGAESLLKTLMLWDSAMKRVRLYRLGCNMEPEAAIVSYNGMQNQTEER